MSRSALAAVGMILALAGVPGWAGDAVGDGPLPVRNLSPATLLYGLPRPLGAVLPAGAGELALTVEHVNNFTAGAGADVVASFDGTTTVTSLTLRRATAAGLEWGAEVPWVWHTGGFTDHLIDGFHDLFGFPTGGRQRVPRDRLDYRIDVDGGESIRVVDSGAYLGDLRGWLGYPIHASPDRTVALRGAIKLPTGRVRHLSGSEGTDVSLALEVVDRLSLARLGTTVTLMTAVTRLGAGDLAPRDQRDWVASGHLGLQGPAWGPLRLLAQVDAHSEIIDSDTAQVSGHAVQLTFGGRFALPRAFALDLALSEDLTGGSAPDVVFHAMLTRRF